MGLERTLLPLLATHDFGLHSDAAILSFLVSFGIVKALANLFAGRMGKQFGRKRLLVIEWLFGLVAPVLIIVAPSWGLVVFANMFLGINQGLCWSTTVVMKIDLVGPKQRGLAMGFNEAAGYLAVSAAALAAGDHLRASATAVSFGDRHYRTSSGIWDERSSKSRWRWASLFWCWCVIFWVSMY